MKRHNGAQVYVTIFGREDVTPKSIKHSAGTNKVAPSSGLTEDGCRICEMTIRRFKAVFAKSSNCILKTKSLIFSQRLAGGFVGGSKMSHEAVNTNLFETAERASKI